MSPTSPTAQIDDDAQDAESLPRKPLGALLVEAGLVDETRLAKALHDVTRTGDRLGEVVVRRGWANEDDVARLLAKQWELSYVDRGSIRFDANALGCLPREEAQQLKALPARAENDRVVVALAEPTEQRLAELRRIIGEDTAVVVVPKTALDAGFEEMPIRERPTEGKRAARRAAPSPLSTVADRPDGGADLTDLAARARDIADFVAGQAASTREYERRIEELEGELAESRAATQETRTQLAAVLQLVDVLKPKPAI